MISYKDIKDFYLYYDNTFNEYETLDAFINKLEECIKEQRIFEDTVYNILKNKNIDDETIASLFTLSKIDVIEFAIKMIKNKL